MPVERCVNTPEQRKSNVRLAWILASAAVVFALGFVAKGPDRWTDLIHGLMMSNEFAFVD